MLEPVDVLSADWLGGRYGQVRARTPARQPAWRPALHQGALHEEAGAMLDGRVVSGRTMGSYSRGGELWRRACAARILVLISERGSFKR
jgi:hypothetical protein